MRVAGVLVLATLVAASCFLSAYATSPVEEEFRAFDLFGVWAPHCDEAAAPGNPHVSITMPSEGLVLEEYDLGPEYVRNKYSVLSATRLSATRLEVAVIFQPGAENEERQKLIFLIRNGTRRTMFNQAEGRAARVKDGVAVALRIKTPVLNKCG